MAKKIIKQAPFKKLIKSRSMQKIEQLNTFSTRLLFWNEKISFEGESTLHNSNNSILVKMSFFGDDVQPYLANGQKFSLSFKHGIHYFFGQVHFLKSDKSFYKFEIFNSQIYKFERRKKDRLRVYPYKNLSLVKGLKNSSNVIQLNSIKKMIPNPAGKKTADAIGNFNFTVYDIGMNGLSILVDDKYMPDLEKGNLIVDSNLRYKDEMLYLSEVKVMYNISFLESEKSVKRCKIGLSITNPHEDPLKWLFQLEEEPYVSEEERVLFQQYIVTV